MKMISDTSGRYIILNPNSWYYAGNILSVQEVGFPYNLSLWVAELPWGRALF